MKGNEGRGKGRGRREKRGGDGEVGGRWPPLTQIPGSAPARLTMEQTMDRRTNFGNLHYMALADQQ